MEQNKNLTRTIIKIQGNIQTVKDIAAKFETLFPLYIESPIKMNDNGVGSHIFITLPGETVQEKPLTVTDKHSGARGV